VKADGATGDNQGRAAYAFLVTGLAVAAVGIAVVAILAAHSGDTSSPKDTSSATGKLVGQAAATTPGSTPASSRGGSSSPAAATTEAPPAGAGRPVTSVPQVNQPIAPPVTGGALPLHGAVYRGGKLYLSGALPSRTIADAFVKKATEVIGAGNVVESYVIDRRAPVPTDGRVTVDEPFLFRTGSAAIDPGYESLLNLGVTVMRLNPQVTMQIIGYTDDTGSLAGNLALSRARAQAVADWISQRGIAPQRFIVTGKGPADPLASNATEQGRTQNRRIEVELLGLLKG
jgi:outer membrane protein OmpA-like peptidoglycan-associated protein